MPLENMIELMSIVIGSITALIALYALISAFRSGVLKAIRFGSVEITASEQDVEATRSLIASISNAPTPDQPFEIEHLARYYAQVLQQSKVAFWFSLVMASIGFFIIVVAALMYSTDNPNPALVQGIAGAVIDAVAALFFVQSHRARASMADFFEKLRKDRQQIESRRLCDEISHPDAQNALRIQLSLYYAGLENHDSVASKIIRACYSRIGSDYIEEESLGQTTNIDSTQSTISTPPASSG